MHVAHYRLWIYSANLAIVLIQLWFIYLAIDLIYDPNMKLLPYKEASALIFTVTTVIPIQFFACACGLIGVYFSHRTLVRLYWTLMIPLIVMDTVEAFVWIRTFNALHANVDEYLGSATVIENHIGDWSAWCGSWDQFWREYQCCPPSIVTQSCWNDLKCDESYSKCNYALLNWLHSRTDTLAGILYFLIYPLKLIVVFVLREDVMELVTEIFYSNHKGEYKHWWELDEIEGLESPSEDRTPSPRIPSKDMFSLITHLRP
ncbi:unnamed protein product [Bursaphelenchus okinawaensis]|uniref:Tetraspanin n=1 Tax=Bursaphelenchus okinawaensis TaxID=465554 RepID=A0A811LLG3_9BILA|nr:unnamed protein product [Bursaphelenchus okinawaensis]CAG9125333.1 unnamed protein product [Bursaphelenchus okinawaensis]